VSNWFQLPERKYHAVSESPGDKSRCVDNLAGPDEPGRHVTCYLASFDGLHVLTYSGSLIYEYIGEVVKENTFRKRMAQYAEEGIRHFYFMMLQKEEVCFLPFGQHEKQS